VEVVCQFRFPTILRIRERQLADFQDKIRNDYPVYSEQEPSIAVPAQVPKEMLAILEQIKMPLPLGLATQRFSTKDTLRFVSLSDQFMALAQTKYERWESFREEVSRVETALEQVYNPSFYSRIGLRYRDMISRSDLGLSEVGWRDLLRLQFIAELGDKDISGNIASIQTQTIVRIAEIPGGQIRLIHGLVERPGSDERRYVIDADFSVERKEGVDEPFKILDKFNRLAGQLFRWAISERLHNAMDPRPV
jgi:uncharacterized protein (TIGR04255 family)